MLGPVLLVLCRIVLVLSRVVSCYLVLCRAVLFCVVTRVVFSTIVFNRYSLIQLRKKIKKY